MQIWFPDEPYFSPILTLRKIFDLSQHSNRGLQLCEMVRLHLRHPDEVLGQDRTFSLFAGDQIKAKF